jgi:integrase
MASVLKHPNGRSPFWYAVWLGRDGKRVWKSTKSKDKALAKRIAGEWEDLEKKGRNGILIEAQARKVVSEIVERATGESVHFQTVEQFLEDWLKDKQGAKAPKTVMRYSQTIRSFLKDLKAKAKSPLAAIAPPDVRRWTDSLRAEGRSVPTTNGALKVLSAAFEQARRLGYISTNPCLAISAQKDEEKADRDIFTLEQVRSLTDAARDTDWEGAVLVGFYTGLRLRDVSSLLWDTIDTTHPEKWFIRIITSKTGKGVAVPVHPELKRWLEKQKRGIGKAPVFQSLRGKYTGGKSGLSGQFKRLMEKAGVMGKTLRKGIGAGRTTSSLSFHSLRHSFTSAMAAAGVPEEIRMILTGHTTKTAHKIYTHHEEAQVWGAIAAIPRIL